MHGDPLLDHLADAVLDATPVDWAAAESKADAGSLAVVRNLRLVASVGELNRHVLLTSADAHRADDRPQWGHLRLIERIGSGTFGEVFRAWDARLDREVALKLIPTTPESSVPGDRSFIQEGRLLAKIRHPNVVTIYGAEQIGDRIGLWMEFVRGRTLEQLLKDDEEFAAADAVHIGVELCGAVSAVHAAGLLHRDIKTHNAMRAEDGRIVLMDFGTGTERDAHTSPADLAGTPLYLAPELLAGKAATIQSDIYSLGVLLYRLVAKTYPVPGQTIGDVRQAHERGERTNPDGLRSRAGPALARIIERACDPRVERRYQTVDELAGDLIALRSRPRIIRRRYATAAAAALVALVLLGLVAWMPNDIDDPVIVVRPIKNLGAPNDNDLADLFTDRVISVLGRVDGLRVKGPETSFSLENDRADLATLGRRLGVNLVLEGDVRFTNKRLVGRATLVSVTGEQVWSEPFDRAVGSEGDIGETVEGLARAIVNRLRRKFPATRMQYAMDLPTLKMYVQARALRSNRGEPSFKAIELYKQVINAYPNHAPALADLAAIYGDLGAQYPTVGAESLPPEDAKALLWPLAQRALDIDESQAEAHAAMGSFHALDLRWNEAEESFLKAIRLEPTRSTLRGDYVLAVLIPSGRLTEAIAVLNEALENDPQSLDLRRILARVQLNNDQYDQALTNSRLVLRADPSFPFVGNFAMWAQLFKGERVEALKSFEKLAAGSDGKDGTADDNLGVKGWIHAINGRHAEAASIAELPKFSSFPLRRAEIYGLLGDADKTLEALEDQADLNPLRAAFYLTYPEISVLDRDPRLPDFRRRRLLLPD
jgi:eukaryotic-like serine/threonine-protein kinase